MLAERVGVVAKRKPQMLSSRDNPKEWRDHIRALIVNHQGWDPGDLNDTSRIKPLSKEELARPFFKMIKKTKLFP